MGLPSNQQRDALNEPFEAQPIEADQGSAPVQAPNPAPVNEVIYQRIGNRCKPY